MIARDEIAAHDIRLQPDLMAACITDIENSCSNSLSGLLNDQLSLGRKTFGTSAGSTVYSYSLIYVIVPYFDKKFTPEYTHTILQCFYTKSILFIYLVCSIFIAFRRREERMDEICIIAEGQSDALPANQIREFSGREIAGWLASWLSSHWSV